MDNINDKVVAIDNDDDGAPSDDESVVSMGRVNILTGRLAAGEDISQLCEEFMAELSDAASSIDAEIAKLGERKKKYLHLWGTLKQFLEDS